MKNSANNSTSVANTEQQHPVIKVFCNQDDAYIIWQYPAEIKDCVGFALYRKRKNKEEVVETWVGFENEKHAPHERKPSTQWPIQRFMWTDHLVNLGDVATYRVAPAIIDAKGKITIDLKQATDWSSPADASHGKEMEAWFNRGIISSQFVANQIAQLQKQKKDTSLKGIVTDVNSPIRKFLGGQLAEKLSSILTEVTKDKTLELYACLFELDERHLEDQLIEIGKRAHIILANGAYDNKSKDKNASARQDIRQATDLHNRMVSRGLAHNKFMVICKNKKPLYAWTGSTNWTINGLFTQVNNGLLIRDIAVAEYYFNQWNLLLKAGDNYPPSLYTSNSKPHIANQIHTWFTPTKDQVDMNEGRKLIANANHGILFLMFNPGPKNTLFNAIQEKQHKSPQLFVHGILNQDPGSAKDPLLFMHRGQREFIDVSTILPQNIDDDFGFWQKEINGYLVKIHSKVIVIDPFSESPIVMTGSHNLGERASMDNDDNLNIIIGNHKLAEQYAVNIMSVYDHFRSRYIKSLHAGNKTWKGLVKNDSWQSYFSKGAPATELKFWLNDIATISKTPAKKASRKKADK